MNIIIAIVKVLSIVAGLSAYAGAIPEKFQGWAIVGFAAASSIKSIIIAVGDMIDDGKKNDSFKG